MEIQKLNNLIQTVQSSQEGLRDKFRKELNQIIPKLDTDINSLFETVQDPKFTSGDNMKDVKVMIKEMTELEEHFQNLENKAVEYNGY